MIRVVPVWQTQLWYLRLLQLLLANPIITSYMPLLLLNAEKEVPQLVVNKILKLLSLKVSRNLLLTEDYWSQLPVLSPVLKGQFQTQITTCPGENGLAGVLKKKLICFNVL